MIVPFNPKQVNPASYDFRLSRHFMNTELPLCDDERFWLDLPTADVDLETEVFEFDTETPLVLEAGEAVTILSEEVFWLPNSIGAQVVNKSSLGVLGLNLNAGNAGWVDPGFHGRLRLLLKNEVHFPIAVTPGTKIGQIIFFETYPVQDAYNGNYQDSYSFEEEKWKAALTRLNA
jgi:dCTP deaminase